MNKNDKIETWLWIFCFMLVVCWVSYVSAHETPQEKTQEAVVSKATENNHDKLMKMENAYKRDIERLSAKLDALSKQQAQRIEQKDIEHQTIQQSIPKPKPIVKKKDVVRNPKFKMMWKLNKYWAENLESYSIKCEFISTNKIDLDVNFILLPKSTLKHKEKFLSPPELRCRA